MNSFRTASIRGDSDLCQHCSANTIRTPGIVYNVCRCMHRDALYDENWEWDGRPYTNISIECMHIQIKVKQFTTCMPQHTIVNVATLITNRRRYVHACMTLCNIFPPNYDDHVSHTDLDYLSLCPLKLLLDFISTLESSPQTYLNHESWINQILL